MKHTDEQNEIDREEVALRALLCRVRTQDADGENGFDELVRRYLPLIERTVDRFSDALVSDTDRDDLRQEALMSLYRAAMSYDLSQDKVSFGLYAQICMTNRMVSFVRSYKKQKDDVLPIDETLCTEETPHAAVEESERLRHTYEVLRRVLSPLEYEVWCHYVGGESAREIAASLGKSEKSVANAITRIRSKLRASRSEFEF